MHGPGVASLAVGRTVGVAPARLYFIGADVEDPPLVLGGAPLRQGIRRIIELNGTACRSQDPRPLDLDGWARSVPVRGRQRGSERGRGRGIALFAISSTRFEVWAAPGRDPDRFDSYGPAMRWRPISTTALSLDTLGARRHANHGEPDRPADYVFYPFAGSAGSSPILPARTLSRAVDPTITASGSWRSPARPGEPTSSSTKDARDRWARYSIPLR